MSLHPSRAGAHIPSKSALSRSAWHRLRSKCEHAQSSAKQSRVLRRCIEEKVQNTTHNVGGVAAELLIVRVGEREGQVHKLLGRLSTMRVRLSAHRDEGEEERGRMEGRNDGNAQLRRTMHTKKREEQVVHANHQLVARRKHLMRHVVVDIYPISESTNEHRPCVLPCRPSLSIAHVHVPVADWLNDVSHWSNASIGYGHVMHAVHLLSTLMDIYSKHALHCAADRSAITQRTTGLRYVVPDCQGMVYCRTSLHTPSSRPSANQRQSLDYGVYLLNCTLAQLCLVCGLRVARLDDTLTNLATLYRACTQL